MQAHTRVTLDAIGFAAIELRRVGLRTAMNVNRGAGAVATLVGYEDERMAVAA